MGRLESRRAVGNKEVGKKWERQKGENIPTYAALRFLEDIRLG